MGSVVVLLSFAFPEGRVFVVSVLLGVNGKCETPDQDESCLVDAAMQFGPPGHARKSTPVRHHI